MVVLLCGFFTFFMLFVLSPDQLFQYWYLVHLHSTGRNFCLFVWLFVCLVAHSCLFVSLLMCAKSDRSAHTHRKNIRVKIIHNIGSISLDICATSSKGFDYALRDPPSMQLPFLEKQVEYL